MTTEVQWSELRRDPKAVAVPADQGDEQITLWDFRDLAIRVPALSEQRRGARGPGRGRARDQGRAARHRAQAGPPADLI